MLARGSEPASQAFETDAPRAYVATVIRSGGLVVGIVLLAMVAAFLALRLYMVLGKRSGHEQALPPKPAEERLTPIQAQRGSLCSLRGVPHMARSRPDGPVRASVQDPARRCPGDRPARPGIE